MAFAPEINPTCFHFFYYTEDIRDLVLMDTSYRTIPAAQLKEGVITDIDKITLTKDEDLFITRHTKDAFTRVFDTVQKIIINGIYYYDTALLDTGSGGGTAVYTEACGFKAYRNIFSVASHPYNLVAPAIIDNLINEFVWRYVVAQWYKTKGLNTFAQENEVKLAEILNGLMNSLFELHKPLILV